MRVISGTARGLKLLAPEGMGTRPTTDRVKESVFNLLQPYIPCDTVLDLFSGSGAMGIEALSRSCDSCVFVDNNNDAVGIIHKNIEKARLSEKADIVKSDALSYLSCCNRKFNIIFLDPPYNKGLLKPVFDKIFICDLLWDDGIIVVETEVGGELPDDERFLLIRQAKYGKTVISIYRRS